MNLAAAFHASVQARPAKPAIFWGDSEITYADLQVQSLALAHQLMETFGVQPGDRVGLWLKNRPEFVPALFGVCEAGAVLVPINSFLKPAEVNYILNDAGINVLITDAELGAHFPVLSGARPQLKLCKIETALGTTTRSTFCRP